MALRVYFFELWSFAVPNNGKTVIPIRIPNPRLDFRLAINGYVVAIGERIILYKGNGIRDEDAF